MQITRTTLRIQTNLKKAVEELAVREDRTLQDIFNQALEEYVENSARKRAKKIVFKTHDLGKPLDNLTRADFYKRP